MAKKRRAKKTQPSKSEAMTAQREKAALLVAQDELTDERIAAELGCSRTCLFRWKKRPEFAARVEHHRDEFRRLIRSKGIAVLENRVRHLQRRHDLMNQVIAERGADPGMQGVPGGRTGLMVHNVKAIGSGEAAERVDLYELDTGLLKELREHEQQAAKELGQWLEKQEVSGEIRFHPITLDGDQQAAKDEPTPAPEHDHDDGEVDSGPEAPAALP